MRESFYSKPEVEVFEQNCSIFIQVKKKKDGKKDFICFGLLFLLTMLITIIIKKGAENG